MGLFRRRHQLPDPGSVTAPGADSARPDAPSLGRALPRVQGAATFGGIADLVHLTGTTTFAKEACLALAVRHGIGDGGYIETLGIVQLEPNNPVEPMAVAVHVDGERIGYLPGGIARSLQLPVGGAWPVHVQLFAEPLTAGLRVEGWAWLAEGTPRWRWSASDRPPMSSQVKAQARHDDSSRIVRESLAEGGPRANTLRSGLVNGVHYLELVEPIKQLKRDGRLEEALELCLAAAEAAEAAREGREPAPWYSEQAAIIHRKLGQRAEEIAVLTRWLTACPPERREGSRIQARLAKIVAGN